MGLLLLGKRAMPRMIELSIEAERLGFVALWIPDERFYRDVYAIAAAAACATAHIRIGPCVTDPYSRHPALTAVSIATLDELSGSRAVLGIGAGISGFHELGIRRDHPAEAVREAVALIRGLLGGRREDVHGRVVRFSGALDFDPPRSSVPIYIAAGGPRMLDAAGAVADGVILQAQVTETELAASVARVRASAARAGRDVRAIEIVARIDVAVDDDLSVAYGSLRLRVARILAREWPRFRRFEVLGVRVDPELRDLAASRPYTLDPVALRPLADRVPDHLVDLFCVAATPATLAQRLDHLRVHSVDQVIVNPVPTRGDDVRPVMVAAALAGTAA